MICFTLLVSFCLLGMASTQTTLACFSLKNHLEVMCKFPLPVSPKKCTFTAEDKVVACSDPKVQQESRFQKRAIAKLEKDVCRLHLADFEEDNLKTINCTMDGGKSQTVEINVEKNKLKTCSDCSVLQHGGLTLLLALLGPLLSDLL